MGFAMAFIVTNKAVSSYLAFSTLPALEQAVCFLWHFPSGHPAPPLAGILPDGARTFLSDESERPPGDLGPA